MVRRSTAVKASSPVPTWAIDIEGQTIALHPRMDALAGIEKHTGHSIYNLVRRASERTMTLEELAMIVLQLAGPECPIDALRSPGERQGIMMPISHDRRRDAMATVIRSGVIPATVAVTLPLMAAVRGALDESGEFQAGWTLQRVLDTKE